MAEMPQGVQVLFDEFEGSDASDNDTTDSSSADNRNYHQEFYPSYVPPHRRGHNTQGDEFVNFKGKDKEDEVQGSDNRKYQRIMIPVPFALRKSDLEVLKNDFPGVYFHCKDNGNHDHPVSHMVTVVGTRLMQRRIRSGARILDVYGNPNACDRFNTSQRTARDPKQMKALVNRVGPSDFIREVNKWGPFLDDGGDERYHRGSLKSLVNSGEIEQYDVLHLTHTLYYVSFEELAMALHAPGKRVAYALVHRHHRDNGSINNGEQTYQKKWVGNTRLIKQVNVATQSAYVHPDLTPILFNEKKVWLPGGQQAYRDTAEVNPSLGLAWECHKVNDDTWVVEFVPYEDVMPDDTIDYCAMWEEDDETLLSDDPMIVTPDSTPSVTLTEQHLVLPTNDGKFLELDIPCRELFDHLRQRASGKPRDAALLKELITTANHLVNPSSLFGDKPGMKCPPDKVYDLAVAAMLVDLDRERLVIGSVADLRPLLIDHARKMKLGPSVHDLCLRDILTTLRLGLQGVRDVNRVVRAKDPIDSGVEHLQGWLQ